MTQCRDAGDVPTIKLSFVKIKDLSTYAKDDIVDVIGVVRETKDITTIVSRATQREIKKRELILIDDSATQVSMTLWGAEAERFDPSGTPIVAVKGAKVGDYQGVNLSAMSSSNILVNPDLPEAHALRGWYETGGKTVTPETLASAGGASGFKDDPRMPLKDVKEKNLGQDAVSGKKNKKNVNFSTPFRFY